METVTIMPHTQQIANIDSTASKPNSSEAKSLSLNQIEEPNQEGKKVDKSDDLKPKEVTEEFNQLSNELNLEVRFAYNEKIDTLYINVTDKSTGRVIRKLPTEEAMKIKESMQDLVGVLFDKKG